MSYAVAFEPVYVGHGSTDKFVNLDAGGRHTITGPYFGSEGFAAPKSPQPMELDAGALVYQSKKLREQSRELYENVSALYNKTIQIAGIVSQNSEKVEKNLGQVEQLRSQASISAEASQAGAKLSGSYCNQSLAYRNETANLYNNTLSLARSAEISAQNIADMENWSGISTGNNSTLNFTRNLRGQILNLSIRVGELEKKS